MYNNVKPQTYWNIWRQIMRNEKLQNVVLSKDVFIKDLDQFNFTEEEKNAAMDYAQKAESAKWFVLNYRFRLVNSMFNALESGGASLTLRSLLAKDTDMDKFSKKFLDTVEWKDYGPYVYTYCKDVLDYLLNDKNIDDNLKDLINLEKSVVKLMLDYEYSKKIEKNRGLLYKTKKAKHYQSSYKLSNWLKNKKELGLTKLDKANENYLVYLPNLENSYKFVMIPERAAKIYSLMDEEPISKKELSLKLKLNGDKEITVEDDKYFEILRSYNAIAI